MPNRKQHLLRSAFCDLRSYLLVAIIGASLAATPVFGQTTFALKGGRIVPISGPVIEGGTIVVRDGKIAAVGKDVAVPTEARAIDVAGKVILPGFIEAHSPRGTDQVNERNPNVPFVSVIDSLDPSLEYFEECRRNGITTVAIVPGNDTMIGGQAAIVKTLGGYVDQMILKRHAGLKLSLRPQPDRSRISHLAALRKELDSVREQIAAEEEKRRAPASPPTATKGGPPPKSKGAPKGDPMPKDAEPIPFPFPFEAPTTTTTPVDSPLQKESLVRLLKGELPAFLYCDVAADVPQALKLIGEYKFRSILVLGPNCYKAAKQVAASKLPVILEPTLVFWETDPRTGEDRQIVLPEIYREAGVPMTFQTTGFAAGNLFRMAALPPTVGANYLWFQAATAVKYGLPAAEAIEAITLRPARHLGVANVVGSIEVGKDADLAVLTGEPLKLDTWVDMTFINGKLVYERAKDERLQKLLQPPRAN